MENAGWWSRALGSCARPRPAATGEALVEAAEQGDLRAVRALLARAAPGGGVNLAHRETALVLAAHHGHEEVVQVLLTDPRVGACSDRVGVALVRAAASGRFTIINILAAERPQAFLTEAAALALRRAVQNGHHLCARSLLRAGVPPDARPPGGPPALFAAAVVSPACVLELVRGGANVNQVDETGKTPLHHAAAANEYACMEELVWAGANRKAVDEEGHLPRDEAISERARDLLSPDNSPVRRPMRMDDSYAALPGPSPRADP